MRHTRPRGVTALVGFFLFGTAMSALAAFLLLVPGTALDVLWRVNPRGHAGFQSMGRIATPLLLVVSCACALTAVGLARLRRWGYRAALTMFTVNAIGDAVNALVRGDHRALIGIPIAALLILYLVRVRSSFSRTGIPTLAGEP